MNIKIYIRRNTMENITTSTTDTPVDANLEATAKVAPEENIDTVEMPDTVDTTENDTIETNATKTDTKKKRKKLRIVLLSLLAIILIAIIAISIIADGNVKAMNDCIDTAMTELKAHYTVTELDPGEYDEMTIYGIMNFDVEQYYIEELGNLSVMRVNVGFMQMATFVITPLEKNAPLLSIDYMYILGNRKCYVEFYDIVEEKDEQYMALMDDLKKVEDKYNYLEDIETSEAWYAHLQTVTFYKGGGSEFDKDFKAMLKDSLSTYLSHSTDFPALSEEERAIKHSLTLDYTNGLVEKGGISTDVFKNSLGDDETKRFFDKAFFGTGVKR